MSKKTYNEEYNPERWKLVEKGRKEEPKGKQAPVPVTRATEAATETEKGVEKGTLERV